MATRSSKKLTEVPIPPDIRELAEAPMRCGDKTVLQFYLERIASGMSPRMAETLAIQQAPGIGITTDIFLADQRRHGTSILDQYKGNKKDVEDLRRNLAKHGYALKSDDQYLSTVARFPGDPEAIVNHTNTLSDVKKSLERRGVEAHGAVNTKARPQGPPKVKHRLHPRIVERIRQRKIRENPDLARADQRSLREEIITKHGSAKETA